MYDILVFENKQWEVLSDCGTFYVAKEVGTDNVRNILKTNFEKTGKSEDTISGPSDSTIG